MIARHRSPTTVRLAWCKWLPLVLGCQLVLVNDSFAGDDSSSKLTETRIGNDLAFLASDELAGRGIGTEGIASAGEFIARRFSELGIKTDAFKSAPFQEFSIPGPVVMTSPEQNFLRFSVQGTALDELQLGVDYTPLSLGGSGQFAGAVAFAGYGITATEYSYDDYGSIDASGKVVIVLRKEPQQDVASSKFEGTQNSQYAYFTSKELNAAMHKVSAMILVDDPVSAAASRTRIEQDLQHAEKALAEIEGRARPTEASELERLETRRRIAEQQVTLLKDKHARGNQASILAINEAGSALTDEKVPTYHCTRSLANRLLVAGMGKTLEELEAAIDRDGAPHSAVLPGVEASGQVGLTSSDTSVRNVIGVLPGAGTLADEYVIIGAHYDHIGMGGMGSLAPGTVAVHNGADDNGSGTVTMLEVARQLAASNSPSRRSFIFMAFTAEESGLLGSVYYVRNPRWPLEKTVAMINLDMVGRLNNDELTVYGTGTAAEFPSQIDRLNERYGFKIVKVPQGRGASDHASFYDAKIPVYHFFTGLHNDYHRPSDDVDKVNVPGIARISNMVTEVAREIAEAPNRPRLLDVKGSASPRSQSGSRAVLGIRLDRSPEAQPTILAVNPGGPAATAGLQAGDLIVEINGKAIAKVAQLRDELTKAKSGETVSLLFRRNSETQTTNVQLGD